MSDWNDAIEAAKKLAREELDRGKAVRPRNDYEKAHRDGYVDCAEWIEKQLLKLKRPAPLDGGWMPIESAPIAEWVLVWMPYSVARVASLCRNGNKKWWIDRGGEMPAAPTHWQPLPAAPASTEKA